MRVKRFVGDSVAEIMKRIKQDLGSEAVILQTRQFKEGGFLKLFGQDRIEIMAGLEDSPGAENMGDLVKIQGNPKNQKSAMKKALPQKTVEEKWVAGEKRYAASRDMSESRADKLYASRAVSGRTSISRNPGKINSLGLGSGKTSSLNMGISPAGAELSASGIGDAGTDKLLKAITQARAQYALEEAAARLMKNQDPAKTSISRPTELTQREPAQTETAQTDTGIAVASHSVSPSFTSSSLSALVQSGSDAVEQVLPLVSVSQGDMKELMSMLREIHYYLNTESGGAGFVPEVLEKWRDYLCRRGISEGLCRELLFQVQIQLKSELWQNDRYVLELLEKNILEKCSCTQIIDVKALKKKDKPLVMALIGPTGVGKTTTIGKLSAGFSIVESRKVSLVAADTYRVAAVEQLRTFGEILGIPVEVVMNAAGLKESIAKHDDKDVIIIDTAGRSPNHLMHMDELEEFMQAAQPDLTLLVISATTSPEEQALVLERFRPLSTHLILTKLDESRCEGVLLDLVSRTDLPLTYLTYGQNVPDDIDVATPEKLVRWILGEGIIKKDVS